MSKKKNKFKKSKKSHQHNLTSERSFDIKASEPNNSVAEESAQKTETVREEAPQEKEEVIDKDKYSYVKRDIKKIGLIMALIILALVGIYILSIKTSALNSIGDWIYKVAHIQTQ